MKMLVERPKTRRLTRIQKMPHSPDATSVVGIFGVNHSPKSSGKPAIRSKITPPFLGKIEEFLF
jgi:hypothetical protein